MKTIRMSVVLAGMVGAATLFLAPISMSGTAGLGWSLSGSNTEESEPISGAYHVSTMASAPGLGFDVFIGVDGVKVEDFSSAYMGTSLGSEASGSGWDVFRIGDGDPLP